MPGIYFQVAPGQVVLIMDIEDAEEIVRLIDDDEVDEEFLRDIRRKIVAKIKKARKRANNREGIHSGPAGNFRPTYSG